MKYRVIASEQDLMDYGFTKCNENIACGLPGYYYNIVLEKIIKDNKVKTFYIGYSNHYIDYLNKIEKKIRAFKCYSRTKRRNYGGYMNNMVPINIPDSVIRNLLDRNIIEKVEDKENER